VMLFVKFLVTKINRAKISFRTKLRNLRAVKYKGFTPLCKQLRYSSIVISVLEVVDRERL